MTINLTPREIVWLEVYKVAAQNSSSPLTAANHAKSALDEFDKIFNSQAASELRADTDLIEAHREFINQARKLRVYL